jgi:type VI secretion system secreted protein Hcp
MKRTFLAAAVLALTTLLSPAASDYLLELDGIKGESSDDAHRGAIEILSFSWGVSNSTTVSGGGTAGKATFKEFTVTKKTDASCPELFIRCATGEHIPTAVLHVRKAGAEGKPETYIKITLTDVLVSSYQSQGSGGTAGASVPEQSISFNYAKIEFEVVAGDGSVRKAGYDLATAKKI